ncbi:MAG: polysaccharide deacetylase family protein [Clostridia bacterium]|nr:polysaccharide deacetylase family protein [Clostridia bacterium]
MKRKIALLVIGILSVLLLFGCSSDKGAASSAKSDKPSSVESAPVSSTEPTVMVYLVGEAEVTLEAGSEYVEQGATSADNSEIVIKGSVNTAKAGEYILQYTSVTEGAAVIERKVKIVDTTPPVITLNGIKNMTVSAESFYKEKGATATDLGDPNVKIKTTRTKTKKGVFKVTYTATDFSGNTSSATRTVTVKDIVAPTVKLKGNTDIYVMRDSRYTDAGYTAKDDLDGDVTASVSVSGSVNTAVCGAYTLTYAATDKSGNVGTATRVVHIFSMEADCPDRVYLTFDDGPNSTITPKVLDALKRNGVKATFFIIDYPESRKALVKRIVDEGHTLAIHTYNHDYSVCYASDAAYMNGLQIMHDKILADTGYDARIIRFPGGTSNTTSRKYSVGIMSRLAAKTVEAGYSYFDWNVDSGDASGNGVATSTIYNNVKKGLRRGRNNVVLMHDAYGKNTTVEALDDIINYCKANGYAVLPITMDTAPVRHKANN